MDDGAQIARHFTRRIGTAIQSPSGDTLELFKQAKRFIMVRTKPLWKKSIDEYLQAVKDIQYQDCIFTTHKKALHVIENRKIDTVIFDENPCSTLKESIQYLQEDGEENPEEIIFPLNKKVVILTAEKEIPEIRNLVDPERLEILEIPPITKQGSLYMNPKKSFTKFSIKKDVERFVQEVKDAVNQYQLDGVITHKDYRELLEQNGITVFTHFGAVEGTNRFSGKNIGIFGVPHLPPEAVQQVQKLFDIKPGISLEYRETYQEKWI